jgi:hypothetical protein
VLASILYTAVTTIGMMLVGRNMVVARVNTRTTPDPHPENAETLASAQRTVIQQRHSSRCKARSTGCRRTGSGFFSMPSIDSTKAQMFRLRRFP